MNIYKFIYLIPIKFKVAFSLDWEVLEKRRVGVKVFAGFVAEGKGCVCVVGLGR